MSRIKLQPFQLNPGKKVLDVFDKKLVPGPKLQKVSFRKILIGNLVKSVGQFAEPPRANGESDQVATFSIKSGQKSFGCF